MRAIMAASKPLPRPEPTPVAKTCDADIDAFAYRIADRITNSGAIDAFIAKIEELLKRADARKEAIEEGSPVDH